MFLPSSITGTLSSYFIYSQVILTTSLKKHLHRLLMMQIIVNMQLVARAIYYHLDEHGQRNVLSSYLDTTLSDNLNPVVVG